MSSNIGAENDYSTQTQLTTQPFNTTTPSISLQSCTGDNADEANPLYKWESDGTGQFSITDNAEAVDGLHRGSKITMHLKEDCKEFSDPER